MFTITVLSGCFLAAISCRIKKVKAPVLAGLFWYIHLVFLFFAALCLILMISGYGFKGTYTERIFLTFYVGTGIILYGLTPGDTSGKFAYLCLFFGFPFLMLAGVILPPLRILTVVLGLGLLSDGHTERYTIDDDYALQAKTVDVIYRLPDYSLIEDKYWLFEKITTNVVAPESRLQALKMEKKGADSLHVFMSLAGDAGRTRNRLDTTISLHQ